jgi:diadenosine tetraphosphate (Ap4A) HIT family hydrolase
VTAASMTCMCALCLAVADAARNEQPFLYNRKLVETRQFLVLPSLGPLVPGHVMVVSKTHCTSLAAMGADAIEEYESLAVRLRGAPLLRGSNPLEAEHGSTADDKAGACVIHTHVHWLPGMGHFLEEFKQRLSLRTERGLLDLGSNGGPYIFARAGAIQAVFHAHGLRSQTIRRVLCDLMDRDDTDWVQAPRLDWVEETVRAWQTQEKEL